MINLLLFGPPGSGKGTQATQLAEKYHLLHISTGDLFRSEIGNGTALGLKAKSYIDVGELVPDSVTVEMLKNKVESNPGVKGYIFDGFPRTIPQAEALDTMLAAKGTNVSLLVELIVDDEEIVKRIALRGETSGRGADKDENITRNRIVVYNKETAPVARHYDKTNRSKKVEGMGGIDEIFERLCAVIDTIAIEA